MKKTTLNSNLMKRFWSNRLIMAMAITLFSSGMVFGQIIPSPTISNNADISDPCACNLDGGTGLANGTFSETVTVTGNAAGETWEVVFVNSLNPGGTAPTGIALTNVLTDNTDGTYEITFDHTDLDGYVLTVRRTASPADNFDLTIYNVCQTPVIEINLDDSYTNKDANITLDISAIDVTGVGTVAGSSPTFSLDDFTSSITAIDFNTATEDVTTGQITGSVSPYTLTAQYELDATGSGSGGQLGVPATPTNACPVQDTHAIAVTAGELSIVASAVCVQGDGTTAADEGSFFIEVSAVTGTDGFSAAATPADISIDHNGNTLTGTFAGTSIYIGPFTHSIYTAPDTYTATGGNAVVVIDATVLNGAFTVCTGTLSVLETVCYDINDNETGTSDEYGDNVLDFNTAGCDLNIACPKGVIVSTADPATMPENTVQYYLLFSDEDNSGSATTGDLLVGWNNSGLFEDLDNDDYVVYSINAAADDASLITAWANADVIAAIAAGTDFDDINTALVGSANLCSAVCETPYTVDCSCCDANAPNLSLVPSAGSFGLDANGNAVICAGSDIAAYTSSFNLTDDLDPDATATTPFYQTAYILANSTTGTIMQFNTTGDFITIGLAVGIYDIFVLNYATFNSPGDIIAYLATKATVNDIVADDSDDSSYGLSNGTSAIPDPASFGTFCLDLDQEEESDDITTTTDGIKVQLTVQELEVTTTPAEVCNDSGTAIDLSPFVTATFDFGDGAGPVAIVEADYTFAWSGGAGSFDDNTILGAAYTPGSSENGAVILTLVVSENATNGPDCQEVAQVQVAIQLVQCGTPWDGQ